MMDEKGGKCGGAWGARRSRRDMQGVGHWSEARRVGRQGPASGAGYSGQWGGTCRGPKARTSMALGVPSEARWVSQVGKRPSRAGRCRVLGVGSGPVKDPE